MEQLRLDLFGTHVPGACPNEEKLVAIGGGKSYCRPWGRWTNCREVGRCVWELCGFTSEQEEENGDGDE